MTKGLIDADAILNRAKPLVYQKTHEIQPFGHLVKLPIALGENCARKGWKISTSCLRIRSRTVNLYKKHNWQAAGPTFEQLHLLFDKHYEPQNDLVDKIGERIHVLGGVSIAMSHDVAETTLIPRRLRGREVAVQISRLLHAHEIVLNETRAVARRSAEGGDDGTNDLLVSDVFAATNFRSGLSLNMLSTCP